MASNQDIRIKKKQYNKAREFEQKMISRVRFLAKEENKFIRKIEQTRDEAMRMQQIKSSKIDDLTHKIHAEKQTQLELEIKLEQAKAQRESIQALKLKRAYEEMVQFEI